MTGTYAEAALCLAHHVYRLPDHLNFSEGAALGVPYASAYRALFQRAELRAGEWLLVHGASGGVGIATVQLARQAGLRVIGTAGSEPGRQLLTRFGVSAALDHHDPHHGARIMALTGGHGVDAIIEMAAHLNLAEDLRLLARRGRVVVVGSRGSIEINPRDTMSRDAAILGMSLMNLSPEETKAIHRALAQDYATDRLRPVIRAELRLESAAEAHRLVIEGRSLGKIVLLP
ncbi:MAG: NADPH:quinone reductase [Gammaproteobacteria bacterium]